MKTWEDFGFKLCWNGPFFSISDTKEHCYVSLLKYLQKENFKIYGLAKTASGNSHDEDWQTKYTFITSDNSFSEFCKKQQNSNGEAYVSAPIVEFIESLTEEEMVEWSKKYEFYSGEENQRVIYAIRDNEKYHIVVEEIFPYTVDKSRQYDRTQWDMRKNICILSARLYKFEQ